MTADGTDDNIINLEDFDGPYTFMDTDDGEEPRDDVGSISPADEEHQGSPAMRTKRKKRGVLAMDEFVDQTT